MKLNRQIKTGAFAIVSILLFILGYQFLKGSSLFETSKTYYVKYNNVAGLEPAAAVTVNGMQVGKVKDIYLETNIGGKVVVEFVVEKDFQFSKSSIIKIYSSGFIGGNNLAILPDYTNATLAKNKDTLQGQIQAGMIDGILEKFNPIEKSLLATLSKLDSVLGDLHQVMDVQTKNNLKQGIANLNATLASFNGVASNANKLLANNQQSLNNTISNLDKTSKNFAQLSDSLSKVKVGELVNEMETTLNNLYGISAKINNGEGSVGKLLKDEKLYNNLEGAAKQLEQLLEDMKQNPKRYVHFSLFGKRPKPYENTNNNPE